MNSRNLWIGAAAGLIATVPMTAVMIAGHRKLARRDRYALPPRRITDRVRGYPDGALLEDGGGFDSTTFATHFAYGASTGAIYGAIEHHLPGPPAVKGAAYGAGVWGSSYLALMPATGFHPSAMSEPAGRNAIMIVAHLVWGATLGLITDRLKTSTISRANRTEYYKPSKRWPIAL